MSADASEPWVLSNPWREREPWAVTDPDYGRIWLPAEPLPFYLIQSEDGTYFVCDRRSDFAVPGSIAKSAHVAVRLFYKVMGRPIPIGTKLDLPASALKRLRDEAAKWRKQRPTRVADNGKADPPLLPPNPVSGQKERDVL